MLHEFITANRPELIARCRAKAALRFEPTMLPPMVEHGVPVLLEQIADMLRCEQATSRRESPEPEPAPADSAVGKSAALHGTELLQQGYSIDQVVHEYGDVCQAITAMAVERDASISADEFRTLNRCLDNAIADAVTSFGSAQQGRIGDQAQSLQGRLRAFSDEHRRMVDIAIKSFAAIRTGEVGLTGATGTLLTYSLEQLRSLSERTLPELHLLSEATTISSR